VNAEDLFNQMFGGRGGFNFKQGNNPFGNGAADDFAETGFGHGATTEVRLGNFPN